MYFRVLTLSGLMLMACTSVRSTTNSDPHRRSSERHVSVRSVSERQSIVNYASKYVGAPYRYGGVSPSQGFDCSGFTSYVLNNFGFKLPRTSTGQSVLGRAITFENAQPGDLLFFGRGRNIQHVGLVVSNNRKSLKMIHSSSSRGVIVEDMRQSTYWKKRIMFAIDLSSL